jgi:hypothetical protein
MNVSAQRKLTELRSDYTKVIGRPFRHFFCPILFKDEQAQLKKMFSRTRRATSSNMQTSPSGAHSRGHHVRYRKRLLYVYLRRLRQVGLPCFCQDVRTCSRGTSSVAGVARRRRAHRGEVIESEQKADAEQYLSELGQLREMAERVRTALAGFITTHWVPGPKLG